MRCGLCLMLVLSLLLPGAASAEHCATEPDGQLLIDQEGYAQIWNWGWTSLYGVAASVQFGIAAAADEDDLRLDMLVGGGKSTVGMLAVLIDPLRVEAASPPCSEQVPKQLAAAARSQSAKRGWWPHTGAFLLNASGALVVGLVDGRWKDAAIQAAIGMAVGEIQIFTTPTGARDRLESQPSVGVVPLREGLALGFSGAF